MLGLNPADNRLSWREVRNGGGVQGALENEGTLFASLSLRE